MNSTIASLQSTQSVDERTVKYLACITFGVSEQALATLGVKRHGRRQRPRNVGVNGVKSTAQRSAYLPPVVENSTIERARLGVRVGRIDRREHLGSAVGRRRLDQPHRGPTE